MPYRWLPLAFAYIALRGIEPHEVLQVLTSPRRTARPMTDPAGVKVIAIGGITRAGRWLTVVVRVRPGFDQEIVGAWDMTDEEREAFDELDG